MSQLQKRMTHPFACLHSNLKIGFVQTLVPGLKKSLVSKASSATAARLSAMGLDIADERHCEHNEAAVAENLSALAAAGCDIVLVLGASAIVDRRDTVPAALVAAGGEIDHLGLPVDPGNLLLFAKLGDTRVLGIPAPPALPGYMASTGCFKGLSQVWTLLRRT